MYFKVKIAAQYGSGDHWIATTIKRNETGNMMSFYNLIPVRKMLYALSLCNAERQGCRFVFDIGGGDFSAELVR